MSGAKQRYHLEIKARGQKPNAYYYEIWEEAAGGDRWPIRISGQYAVERDARIFGSEELIKLHESAAV
jgi:hypothetical protein